MKRYNTCTFLFTVLLSAALTVTALAKDGAPIAQNMELRTYRGVALSGQLKATDTEGDTFTFALATPPVKGDVTINDDGSFTYTPAEGKWGKDYFGYTVTDSKGNKSQEATVIITLVKQKTDVFYVDLAQSGSHYAAVRLAEEDLFVGEQIGGQYVFSPNTMISRGEFLTLCVALSDSEVVSGAVRTAFSDDSSIPDWQKRYITTALLEGCITPVRETGSTSFETTAPITCAEAAVMIDRLFSLTKVSAMAGPDTPDWAIQSVSNLIACNVLPKTCDTAQYLNRSMAADILSNVMDILEQR